MVTPNIARLRDVRDQIVTESFPSLGTTPLSFTLTPMPSRWQQLSAIAKGTRCLTGSSLWAETRQRDSRRQ